MTTLVLSALYERFEREDPIRLTSRLRAWAQALQRDVRALYLAARDPRVPWYAKVAAIAVAAYALSPIDLIPDFIPVLGYLDDLVIVPLGILLAVRLVGSELMAEFRASATTEPSGNSLGKVGATVIVALWIVGIVVAALWFRALWRHS